MAVDGTMRVRVTDLPLLADIGINPDERGQRQPLVINVEVVLKASQVDAINDTVDYRRIVRAAEELAVVHIPLIETFAMKLGELLLNIASVS
jgi:dihydroneopterin aldolase